MDLGIGGLGEATQIGAGASAIVYQSRQLDLERNVAVKVLTTTDEAFVRRFKREAKTLGKLSENPGIVTVFDTGENGAGQPYLVLELCESSLLDRIKQDGAIDAAEACGIMHDVAIAVGSAHELGVIHRDIKPGNVLVAFDGRYMVTDFGIAAVVGATAGSTTSVAFTAGYAAPETFQTSKSEAPADVYAMGATLFHLVNGKAAFLDSDGEPNLLAIIHRVISEPVPDLRPTGVPEDVCLLIEWAMAKEPSDRPTVAQFAEQAQLISEGRTPDIPATVDQQAASQADATVPMQSEPPVAAPAGEAQSNLPATEVVTIAQSPSAPPVNPEWNQGNGALPMAPPVPSGASEYDNAGYQNDGYNNPGYQDDVEYNAAPGSYGDAKLLSPEERRYLFTKPEKKGGNGWMWGAAAAFLGSVALGIGLYIGFLGGGSNAENPTEEVAAGPDTSTNAPTTQRPASGDGTADSVESADASGTETPSAVASDDGDNRITVPNLAGFSEAGAIAELERVNLRWSVVRENSTTVDEGKILRTSPSPGRLVDPGSDITIYVSEGPPKTALRNVVGQSEADAKANLSGYQLVVTNEPSETVDEGDVIKTVPAAGTLVIAGSDVTIIVSTGPDCSGVEVPEVVGQSLNVATAALSDANLTTSPTEVPDADVADGTVISASPGADSCVDENSAVALNVSCGAPVVVPPITGWTVANLPELEALGFEVAQTQQTSEQPAGSVLSLTPTSGSELCEGTAIAAVIAEAACETVEVSDEVGRSKNGAINRLEALGLVVSEAEASSGTVDEGDVISTSPVAGTEVCEGDAIVVTVSTGPVCADIPPTANVATVNAKASLENLGFVVTVIEETHPTINNGLAIRTAPPAGTERCDGQAVSLYVSDAVVVPSVLNQPIADANAAITAAGLVPNKTNETELAPGDPRIGTIRRTNPVGGQRVAFGSKVNTIHYVAESDGD